MAFPTDDIYLGPASFGRRKGTEGIIWHTTEAAGTSRAAAVATAEWQKRNPGSYNFIIYDTGVLLTVPYLEASGGVNPASVAWDPSRYPQLRQELSAAAYADPNAYLLNVAFSGRTAVFRDQGLPLSMEATAKRLIAWAEATFGRPMVHSGHYMWQTNRSDPSPQVLAAIGVSDVPIFTRPVRQQWHIPAGTEFYTGGPQMGDRKSFTVSIDLWSNGETTDGDWRRMEYHNTASEGEDLWVLRSKMTPISGTRNPASGFGEVTTSGYSQAQLDAAKAEGNKAGQVDMKTRAGVAVGKLPIL